MELSAPAALTCIFRAVPAFDGVITSLQGSAPPRSGTTPCSVDRLVWKHSAEAVRDLRTEALEDVCAY
jgi:hypothetical protein